jgi:hypothetical protein
MAAGQVRGRTGYFRSIKLTPNLPIDRSMHAPGGVQPELRLGLPTAAKPYSLAFTTSSFTTLSFTTLSFTTEGTENTEFFSVLSVLSVAIIPQLNR